VGAWLVSRGLNFPELRIENGSGLSRVARISARHVGDLLMDAYRSPYRNHLMQSLAVAGVDGTMKRRLKRTRVRGRGYFKTGTLRDVRSIAGYVKAADGKVYVMSILHNDPRAKRRALPAHDKLIEWVHSATHSRQLAMK
jgi:D-alanyl-D-alanine carboxypeptidase/D-alanyl-D-alanine-endopeptidase (penicillin-binding protein 4)